MATGIIGHEDADHDHTGEYQPLDSDLTTIAANITAAGHALLDDANAAAQIATLGLDADIATLSLPASTTISAFGKTLVDDADATAAIATLGLDADIATLALPASTTISAYGKTLVDDADAATALGTLGLTATATELNYTDGVTSAIQTQLDAKAADSAVVHDTGDETVAGVKTFSSDPIIPDEAYGVGWNGVLEPATKNAIYDKIETMGGGVTLEQVYDALGDSVLVPGNNIDITHVDGSDTITIAVETLTLADISDVTASITEVNYIDGVTSAIQTQLDNKVNDTGDETIAGVKTFSSDPIIPDEAYDATAWNGSLEPATKNAIRDKIETMGGGVTLEQVYDALGDSVLVPGNNIDITHVDGSDTITIAVETLTLADISDVTASVTEVNYTDGVTSAIQTQIDGKQPLDTDLTTLSTAFTTASASGAASLALAEDTDNGVHAVTIQAPAAVTANVTQTLQDVAGTILVTGGTDVAVADGGTGASTAAAAATNLGLGTGDSPQFTAVNIGHASDTTVSRSSAGVIAVEGVAVPLNSTTNTHTAQQIELGHASDTTITRVSAGVVAVEGVNVSLSTHDHTLTQSAVMVFGNATDVITVGETRRFRIPVAHTLVRWSIWSSVSGSIVFRVSRDTWANAPTTTADEVSTSRPTLSSATNAEDSSITDWTSEVGGAGDAYLVDVISVTSCTDVTLELWYTRTIA
jgi:hypothetical protein